MEPYRISYNELLLYVFAAGIVIGILLGLIPLILGIKKKNRKYGMYGFVGSVIGGAITPIISIIVVAIFSWLILRNSKAEIQPSANEAIANTNADAAVSDSEKV